MPRPTGSCDYIRVNDLLLIVPLSTGAHWPEPGELTWQPVLVSFSIPHDVSQTASTDDLSYSINYSTISSLLQDSLSQSSDLFVTSETLASKIFDLLLESDPPLVEEAHLKIVQSKPPLHCRAVGLEARGFSPKTVGGRRIDRHFLQDIECHTIVGINPCEREEKQVVRLNVSIEHRDGISDFSSWFDFRSLTRRLCEVYSNRFSPPLTYPRGTRTLGMQPT